MPRYVKPICEVIRHPELNWNETSAIEERYRETRKAKLARKPFGKRNAGK